MHDDDRLDTGQAVRDTLAPLKTVNRELYDRAVGHVLEGVGPAGGESEICSALEALPAEEARRLNDLLDEPGPDGRKGFTSPDVVAQFAALHPGWTEYAAERARGVVYAAADPAAIARLGRVLLAVTREVTLDYYDGDSGERVTADAVPQGVPAWLALVVNDAAHLGYGWSRAVPAREFIETRWTPDFVRDVAVSGDVPEDAATSVTLTVLLERHAPLRNDFDKLVDTAAGRDFLNRHADVVAVAAPLLTTAGKIKTVAFLSRDVSVHGRLLAQLAVDDQRRVRVAALAELARLDARTQTGLLAPHLLTAPVRALREVLAQLTGLDGGPERIDAALSAIPDDADRAATLRAVAERGRALREPVAGLEVPAPRPVPPDALPPDLHEALTGLATGAFFSTCALSEGLQDLTDARDVLVVLADHGLPDPARRLTSVLIRDGLSEADAERWWPLFAERLDLADEYLELLPGPDRAAGPQATAAMLKILAHFPVIPDVLVPRLTGLALSDTRYRRGARRVLAQHRVARVSAERGLRDGAPMTRASAAEWLAELGEADIVVALRAALATETSGLVRSVLARAVEVADAGTTPEPGWFPLELVPAAAWDPGAPVPPQVLRRWFPRALDELGRFREKAEELGVPREDVDAWLGIARSSAVLNTRGSGPVVGRLGGPVLLPPDARLPHEEPDDEWAPDPLVATIDLGALPDGATNLPFPGSGTLMLFATPAWGETTASAMYVPANTPVEERHLEFDPDGYIDADEFTREVSGDLHVEYVASLPDYGVDEAYAPHRLADIPGDPSVHRLLRTAWDRVLGGDSRRLPDIELGGYPHENEGDGDPVAYVSQGTDIDGWVLLATWKPSMDGFESSTIYWAAPQDDLAVGRLDRVRSDDHSNP
ncbi:hypothetical protein QMA61_37005 [Streptomyces coelicoflavus]|uniref:hypothetical protein n=1 Tax=Streptomyces TaxID=1883 RepID=UPI0012915882|nr:MULTISPECIES: hypothetical protein [Streptomyces]MBQ0953041.1 hypothetical protein [Streptomyces sp. RK76]MDI6521774.1 hypothetical protein [Streptomyces coelicoflavus]QFX86808.1 hypothetical protein GEV49_38840 [Streptomyces sp. SYP-A7193]